MQEGVPDFLFAVMPLVVGHLIVPPLSYFELFGPEGGAPRELVRFHDSLHYEKQDVLNLLLRLPNYKHPWNFVTYNFVHANYSHLLRNLASLLVTGYDAWSVLGTEGYYLLFFAGSVISVIPSPLRDRQQQTLDRNVGKAVSGLLPEHLQRGVVGEKLSKVTSTVTGWTLAHLDKVTHYAGSSGSVYAIVGASLCKVAYDICVDFGEEEYGDERRARRRGTQLRRAVNTASKIPLFMHLMTDLTKQVVSIYDVAIPGIKSDKMDLDELKDLYSVALAGHVQAAAFGFVSMAFVLWHRRRRRTTNGVSRTLGSL